jgi:hypothetical protein
MPASQIRSRYVGVIRGSGLDVARILWRRTATGTGTPCSKPGPCIKSACGSNHVKFSEQTVNSTVRSRSCAPRLLRLVAPYRRAEQKPLFTVVGQDESLALKKERFNYIASETCACLLTSIKRPPNMRRIIRYSTVPYSTLHYLTSTLGTVLVDMHDRKATAKRSGNHRGAFRRSLHNAGFLGGRSGSKLSGFSACLLCRAN